MRHYKSQRKLVLVFALAASILGNCGSAEAGVTITNGLTKIHKVTPGEIQEGHINIQNNGLKSIEITASQTDYSFACDGKKYYPVPGSIERSNAHWITFSPNRLTIPAHDSAKISYTIAVPAEGIFRGTYWSLLMIQEAPETRVNQQDNKKGISLGIQQVFRYGIQIITDFGETGSREIELLDSALYNMNEAKILQIDIKNSGERWLRPFLYADLYDAEGQLIERMEGGRHRIFPGTSARYKIDLSAIKENQCTAMLLFDNKDTFVFGARMKLDFTQLQKK